MVPLGFRTGCDTAVQTLGSESIRVPGGSLESGAGSLDPLASLCIMTFRLKKSAVSVLVLFLVVMFSMLDEVEGKIETKTVYKNGRKRVIIILNPTGRKLVGGFVGGCISPFQYGLMILTSRFS
jgi:hypothetical protein